jgi:hypothetical protein
MGDFNARPDSSTHALITEYGGVVDAWAATHPLSATSTTAPTDLELVEQFGMTCDSRLNFSQALRLCVLQSYFRFRTVIAGGVLRSRAQCAVLFL